MKALRLDGRCALVTGSTRGIGAAIADGMQEAGARVIRHGRTVSGDESGPVLLGDLAEAGAVEDLLTRAVATDAGLDLLVCNAGSFFDAPFLEMDAGRWQRTMDLNLRAPYFLIQAFARHLQSEGRSGAVVIIGSTNGFLAEEGSTAYDISKGGLVMMTKSLAMALAPLGIRVNSVAPGLIRTPLTAPWMDAQPDKVAHYGRKILLGRIGTSEECAGGCVYLCSAAASYVTGQTLVIDGGISVGQIGSME